MTTAADVIRVASSQLGYLEAGGSGGHSGNVTKFWSELDPPLQGQSWCAVFVSWVFKHAGQPLPPMDRPYGYMNCASAVHYAKANGLFDASGHYAPGDIILYGPGGGQHTGIVVSDDGRTVVTIEGNTSSGESGSQWNGGGVYLRHRPHGPFIYGVLKASRWLAPPASPVPAIFAKRLDVDGDLGPATMTALRIYLNRETPADMKVHGGGWDVWTVKHLQRFLNKYAGARVAVDGDLGPNTTKALQRYLKVPADGDWGPQTTRALQTFLNNHPGN
jgi:hypothetical protein